MKSLRIIIALTLLSALFVFAAPGWAQCSEGDPDCPIAPPQSRQISQQSTTGDSSPDALEYGGLNSVEVQLPMPLPEKIDESDLSPSAPAGTSRTTISFDTLDLPMYYQDSQDVSCGVQALGMALAGIENSAPRPKALMEFLSGQGMLYDFGTGVEELAHAAQSFGYKGSLPFHGASIEALQSELGPGNPIVVSLGTNGAGVPGHFVTLTGISPDGEWVAYNDPTLGKQVVSRAEFERMWSLQGNAGVAIAAEPPKVADSQVDFAPFIAMAAGLMALISQTPLALQRMGIGGKFESSGASGGSLGKPPYPAPAGYEWIRKVTPRYRTVWKQDGWTYENKTVPKYEKARVRVGTTTVYDKIPRMKTIKVQDGWDTVEKVVPRMVRKRVKVGTTTVYDKIPQYKTVRVRDGWTTSVDRVRTYRTVRYVKYYRTTRQRKPVYRYRWGRRYFAGYRYVTKRTPVYGTRRVFNGYKRVTRRVSKYVNKRVFDGYKVVATEVPKYETRLVQDGWRLTHEKVPHMVEKRVQDGWDFVPQEVPKYEWRDQQVGWTTEKYRVPKTVQVQEPDGYDVIWELDKLPATESNNGTSGSNGGGHADGWQSWAGNSDTVVQSDGEGDDPVLEPVPGFFSDPLGYLTTSIINFGRESDTAKDTLEETLVPAAEWLQSIPDPEAHPILSEIHNNVPEEGAALLAGALVTPMQGDEVAVAVGLGLLVIGSLTINHFSGKNWQPPGARLPRQPLPQKEVLERILPGSPPGPPWNPDPNKQPEDIPPDEIANLKGIGKVIFILSSLAVVAKSLILGETEPGDPDYPLPTAQPDPTATNTPTLTPTTTPTDTPTATPSPTTTPSPTPTNTSTHTPAPSPTPSPTLDATDMEVATSDSN